jgi:hypothetical protein
MEEVYLRRTKMTIGDGIGQKIQKFRKGQRGVMDTRFRYKVQRR